MERPRTGRGGDESDLLLAPIHATGEDKDPIHEFIRALDKRKGDLENGRLLYVAATRAKRRLHLLGDARRGDAADAQAIKGPKRGSLLAKLWPIVAEEFSRAPEAAPGAELQPAASAIPAGRLVRVTRDFAVPPPPPGIAWRAPGEASRGPEAIEFSWVGETARLAGTVVHRWLQRLAQDALQGWNAERLHALLPQLRAELRWRGVLEADLEDAAGRVERALVQAIDDPKGRWVLGPHPQAAVEYRLTALVDGERRSFVMDRVFTDAAGQRWIVDYKTGPHEGSDVETFLDRERERYAEQLRRYAAALGGEPRLGLYFPLIPGWREVER
jgi:ATP-dependent exoDNAse (exonuclease V) beta subunit